MSATLRLTAIDLARRTDTRRRLPRLRRSQHWPRERLAAAQLDRLAGLLEFAGRHVPHYREEFARLGCVPGVDAAARILAALPVLTKDEVRAAPDRFRPDSGRRPPAMARRTGGSTGEPFRYLVSRDAFAAQWAALYRAWEWCGYRVGDPVVTLGGASVARAGGGLTRRVYSLLRNDHPVAVGALDGPDLDRIAAEVHRVGPRLLYGYPSLIYRLADHVLAQGGPPLRPQAVITTSEMLFPGQRRLIAQACAAPVFDFYGCNEVNLIAGECACHDGHHVAMETCLLEVADGEGQVLPAGTGGRLVATGLLNRAMVLVRYDTGDLGSLDAGACVCGRGLLRIRSLEGRSRDLLRTAAGGVVHGVEINRIVAGHPWVDRWQIVQDQTGAIVVNVASAAGEPPGQRQVLAAAIAELSGCPVDVRVGGAFVETAGRKTRVIISRQGDGG